MSIVLTNSSCCKVTRESFIQFCTFFLRDWKSISSVLTWQSIWCHSLSPKIFQWMRTWNSLLINIVIYKQNFKFTTKTSKQRSANRKIQLNWRKKFHRLKVKENSWWVKSMCLRTRILIDLNSKLSLKWLIFSERSKKKKRD